MQNIKNILLLIAVLVVPAYWLAQNSSPSPAVETVPAPAKPEFVAPVSSAAAPTPSPDAAAHPVEPIAPATPATLSPADVLKDARSIAPLAIWQKSTGNKDTLLIDTTGSGAVWNPCFMTADTLFAPGKMYDISFRCHYLDQPDGSYLLGLLRPLAANNGMQDAGFLEIRSLPKDGIVHFYATIPDSGPRFAFQLHTKSKLKAEISDLAIREMTRAYLPAETTVDAATPAPAAPTGSEDFAVELPRLDSKKTVIAQGKDFGILPDNPDNTSALQTAIDKLRKQTPSRLVLAPGDYRFTSDATLNFASIHDFELDGQGARFVFLKNKGKLLVFDNCERLALRNLSIDWDWEKDPLASIVKIEAVGPQSEWVDLRFVDYQKFPRKDVRIADLEQVNPQTRFLVGPGAQHVTFEFFKGIGSIPRTEWKEDNLLRMHACATQLGKFQTGQFFRIRHYVYDMNGLSLLHNRHLTIDNVHILSCPGMGIIISGIQQYWQILNSSVAPAAGSQRVLSCTADHIHVGSSRGYFRLENTELGWGSDDTLNIHDCTAFAVRTSEHALLTKNVNYLPGNYFQPGDVIELRNDDYSPTGFQAKVKTIKPVNRAKGQYEFIFEETLPAQDSSGFVLIDHRYGTKNVIIRNNRFHHFPRGILLMADNVTIENNEFSDGKAAGIKIETGYTMSVWSEGYGASNIIIRNNRFTRVNQTGRYSFENRPDIYISTYLVADPSMQKSPYPVFQNLLIAGNTFRGTTGSPVFAASVGNLVIRDNTFDLRDQTPLMPDYRGSIGALNTTGLQVRNNRWLMGATTGRPGIVYDVATVKGIVSAGNTVEH